MTQEQLQQKQEPKWKVIEPNMWKPDNTGESIEGVYVNKREGAGKYNSKIYYIDTGNDGIKMVWGSTVLDEKMNSINQGNYVRITLTGTAPSKKGNDIKLFKVEVAQ